MIACKVELFGDQGIRGQSLKCSAPQVDQNPGLQNGGFDQAV